MNALFLLNKSSGRGRAHKRKNYIVKKLSNIFDSVEVLESVSHDHFIQLAKEACGKFDVLIFAGGDGTFNMVANAISEEPKRPILGVIPTGTVNDAAKIFGVKRSIGQAIKVIENQKIRKFDIGKINDSYFVFAAAIGAYADIPYKTRVDGKSRIGPLAYYFKAIPQLFKKRKLKGTITFEDGTTSVFETPFLLIMNSAHIGGFKINPNSNSFDGKMDLFWTEPTIFNSLARYLFRSKSINHYKFKEVIIKSDCKDSWDIDGEIGPTGDASIKILPEHLSIFSVK